MQSSSRHIKYGSWKGLINANRHRGLGSGEVTLAVYEPRTLFRLPGDPGRKRMGLPGGQIQIRPKAFQKQKHLSRLESWSLGLIRSGVEVSWWHPGRGVRSGYRPRTDAPWPPLSSLPRFPPSNRQRQAGSSSTLPLGHHDPRRLPAAPSALCPPPPLRRQPTPPPCRRRSCRTALFRARAPLPCLS
jgi:hypothetical protein